MALSNRPREKRPANVITAQTGEQRQKLARAFERPILAKNGNLQGVNEQEGQGGTMRGQARYPFTEITKTHRARPCRAGSASRNRSANGRRQCDQLWNRSTKFRPM